MATIKVNRKLRLSLELLLEQVDQNQTLLAKVLRVPRVQETMMDEVDFLLSSEEAVAELSGRNTVNS